MKKTLLYFMLACCFFLKASAQSDLLGDLIKEDSSTVKHNIATATFKSTRIINLQSVEMTGKGNRWSDKMDLFCKSLSDVMKQ